MASFRQLIRAGFHLLGVAVMIAALCGLQGCAGGTQPFAKSSGPAAQGKTAPPVTLVELKGLPADKKQSLTDLLVQAAAGHDIAIVQGAFGDGLRLDGSFTIQANGSGTVVGYDWKLADPTGKPLQTFSGAEVGGPSSGNAWSAVNAKVLEQVATSTANTLAAKLSQMGYSTRAENLAVPAQAFAAAGPGADKDVDYETLYGPQAAQSASNAGMGVTTASLAPSEQLPAPATPVAAVKSKAKLPSSEPTNAIKAIALVSVTGSPGGGDRDLKDALRRFLTQAGWPVVDAPQSGALTVKGTVKVDPAKGATQRVALAWAVSSVDGRNLGTVRQANDVPAGSLEKGWGSMAEPAAQSAAEGLFKLVDGMR